MKTKMLMAVLMFIMSLIPSYGIYIAGSSDPNANAGTPPDGCGSASQVAIGNATGTIVGPHHVLTATHIGSSGIGNLIFHGTNSYTITNVLLSSTVNEDGNSRFKVLIVNGTFPETSIAPLYTGDSELGKQVYLHGRGPKRGGVVTTAIRTQITGLTILETGVLLEIKGEKIESTFVVEKNCGTGIWTNMGTFTMPDTGITTVTIPKCNSSSVFFRTKSLTTITNGFIGGMGVDGVIRWGRNVVDEISGSFLIMHFDQNGDYYECHPGIGDSGGGVFMKVGNSWKLVGCIEGSEQGWWQYPGNPDSRFWGPIWDKSGLEKKAEGNTAFLFPFEGGQKPAMMMATRLASDLAWVQSVIK